MGKKQKNQEKLQFEPIALRLDEWRERAGLSREELGARINMTKVSVGRMVNGKQNWNQEALQLAAQVLGVDWADLLTGTGNGGILDVWAKIPPEDRERALGHLKLYIREAEESVA